MFFFALFYVCVMYTWFDLVTFMNWNRPSNCIALANQKCYYHFVFAIFRFSFTDSFDNYMNCHLTMSIYRQWICSAFIFSLLLYLNSFSVQNALLKCWVREVLLLLVSLWMIMKTSIYADHRRNASYICYFFSFLFSMGISLFSNEISSFFFHLPFVECAQSSTRMCQPLLVHWTVECVAWNMGKTDYEILCTLLAAGVGWCFCFFFFLLMLLIFTVLPVGPWQGCLSN